MSHDGAMVRSGNAQSETRSRNRGKHVTDLPNG